jgi:alpha-L-fucosidase
MRKIWITGYCNYSQKKNKYPQLSHPIIEFQITFIPVKQTSMENTPGLSKISATLIGLLLILNYSVHGQITHTNPGAGEWQNLRFGLMMHWGIYSVAGGVWNGKNIEGYNEQIKHRAKISDEDYYKPLCKQFTAEKFDPDYIARLAREAGMKYIVITSKHHDGFNLYHTKLSELNAVDATPFGKDAIKLLSDACARQQMQFGVYYSLIDWHYPGTNGMIDHNSNPITPEIEEYEVGQLRELLTGYGPISEIWFDMSYPTPEQSRKLADLVHLIQPKCMISGRIFNGQEDFQLCSDNEVPDHWYEGPWESAVTVFHDTWGYRSWQVRDNLPGKIREKVREVAFVTAHGGNYLLNIGPKPDGTIVDFEVQMLRGIGQWMKVNGEAIYFSKPEPFLDLDFGYATCGAGRIYLYITDLPADGVLRVPNWIDTIPGVHVLSASVANALPCEIKNSALCIRLDKSQLDSNLTIVAVDYKSIAKPYLPSKLVALKKGQGTVLPVTGGLAWHRIYGNDYWSQRNMVVGREWNIKADTDSKWEVVISRSKGEKNTGYLLTVGNTGGQCILVASEKETCQSLGIYELSAREVTRFKLQSATPGKELDEANLTIRFVPVNEFTSSLP